MKKIEPANVITNKRIINSETVKADKEAANAKPDTIMVNLTDDPNWFSILKDKDDSFDSIGIVNTAMYVYTHSGDSTIVIGSIFLEAKRLFFRAIHKAVPEFNAINHTNDPNMVAIIPIVEAAIFRILNDNIDHTNITVYRKIIRDLFYQILAASCLKADEGMMKELDYFIRYYIEEVIKIKMDPSNKMKD